MGITKFSNSKSDFQNSLKVVSSYTIRYTIHDFYDFPLAFHYNYVSILHNFQDITTYFPKF